MTQKNKKISLKKSNLHPRNRHRSRYDFELLITSCAGLAPFVSENQYGDLSVDFSNPAAVKMLNRSLLMHFYQLQEWNVPEGFLCPPIPGRADYIHSIADLLAEENRGVIPKGEQVKLLDVGVGANCIYPIIARHEYDWQVVGSDISPQAIESAQAIVSKNSNLAGHVSCRLQPNAANIFNDIVLDEEIFDVSICNPPFHVSAQAASAASSRKIRNLSGKSSAASKPKLNFGGQQMELWCEGGEVSFVKKMIKQSAQRPKQILWYSTLISKKDNLPTIYKLLKRANVVDMRTIDMAQGQKISRIVAWSFIPKALRVEWAKQRWS